MKKVEESQICFFGCVRFIYVCHRETLQIFNNGSLNKLESKHIYVSWGSKGWLAENTEDAILLLSVSQQAVCKIVPVLKKVIKIKPSRRVCFIAERYDFFCKISINPAYF